LSILLTGGSQSGKTTIAAVLAQRVNFPLVKVISADKYIGFSEIGKINEIKRVFDDAYKSEASVIIIDDIENIVEYVRIGPHFSNVILQSLISLLKRNSPESN